MPASPATGAGLGEATVATRTLGLGTTDAVRTGVGIGVFTLRVSVAAAPGTGVGSGASNVEHAVAHPTSSAAATSLAKVIAQLLGPTWMAQLTKCLGFDLADPLPSNAEFTTDFLQRTLASVV